MVEPTHIDGMKVLLQEGVVDGQPMIRVRVFDALTTEHALSIAAEMLTARGDGDAEMTQVGFSRGAYEVYYNRGQLESSAPCRKG